MNYLKSRTLWTLVVTFIVNGIAGIHDPLVAAIGLNGMLAVDGALTILAGYFRINAVQKF